MANLLTDLSYAKNIDTYAGQPIDEVDDLMSTFDIRYKTNKGNADKMETLAHNQKVLGVDNELKQNAINNLNEGLREFTFSNDWADADSTVTQLAKDFAMNSGLNLAKANKAARDSGTKALQDRVAKGEISKKEMNYEILTADARYNGVTKNSETGLFEGNYSINQPNDHIDISDEIWKYTKDVKEEKEDLYIKNDKGIASRVSWTENGYVFMESKESVTDKKIYESMRSMILSKPEYIQQLNYNNEVSTYELLKFYDSSKLTEDIVNNSRTLTKDELNYGLSKYPKGTTLKDLELSGNLGTFYNQMLLGKKIDAQIKPSALGLSYQKTDLTYKLDKLSQDAIAYTRKQNEKKEEDVTEKKAILFSNHGSKIVNPTGLKVDYSDNGKLNIENEITDTNELIKSIESSLSISRNIIHNPESTTAERVVAENNIEDNTALLNSHKNRKNYLTEITTDQFYQHLYETNKITKDELHKKLTGEETKSEEEVDNAQKINHTHINTKLKDIFKKYSDVNYRDAFDENGERTRIKGTVHSITTRDGNNSRFLSTKGFDIDRIVDYFSGASDDLRGYKEYNILKQLQAQKKLPLELMKTIDKAIAYKDSKVKRVVEVNKNFEDKDLLNAFITNSIKEPYAPVTYDISTNAKGEQTAVSKRLTENLKLNLNSFVVINEAGSVDDVSMKSSSLYGQEDMTVVGATDFIPGQGQMYKVHVKLKTLNEKTGNYIYTGESTNILVKPRKGNPEFRQIIQESLRMDFTSGWEKKSGRSEATYGNGLDFANTLIETNIEEQSDLFRTTSIKGEDTQNVLYNISGDTRANVTRGIINGKEFYSFELESVDEYGRITETRGQADGSKIIARDLASLELKLTALARAQQSNVGTYKMEDTLQMYGNDAIDKKINRAVRNNNALAISISVAKDFNIPLSDYTDNKDTWTSDSGRTHTTASFNKNINSIDYFIEIFNKLSNETSDTEIFRNSEGSPRWSYLSKLGEEVPTNAQWSSYSNQKKRDLLTKMAKYESKDSENFK